jgi:hypothetical protein
MKQRQISSALLLVLVSAAMINIRPRRIEAPSERPKEAKTEARTKDRLNSNGAQWEAHPEKGWVLAEEIEDRRETTKENPKRANRKLRPNRVIDKNDDVRKGVL